ncbi:hypothetical protein GYMLUDRAFT_647216 [Collybiopsis luxurians FD-317 M1]|nr:hypothetical protein GYMLUDRAFT_647216 [Collybiopsis luxurians FD-317 M1]
MFIKQEKIPPWKEHSDGPRRGGIVILGWSLGNATVLSFLATAGTSLLISDELSTLLEKYVRNCVLYEPTCFAIGCPLPADNPNYIPWEDPSLSPEDFPVAVSRWVSSYYDHPCYDPTKHFIILDRRGIVERCRRRGNEDGSFHVFACNARSRPKTSRSGSIRSEKYPSSLPPG